MAVDILLKIDDIPGDSIIKGHEGSSELLSWSWGMTQSGTAHSGPGAGSGKVTVQDISCSKYIDKASPNLLKRCCNGKPFKVATLTVRKAGGTALNYMVIKLENVIISSVSTGGAPADDRISESFTLNFQKFEVAYKSQTDTGAGGAENKITWNIATNAET